MSEKGARHAAKQAGEMKYRSGQTCKNGHVNPERYTRDGRCYECSRVWSLARARAHPERMRMYSRSRYHSNPGRRYGLSRVQYDELVAAHENKCAICRAAPRSVRHAVDHDHTTGVVRGLLCDACNRGLGYFREKPELLRRAAEYLAERAAWLLG